MHQCWDTAIYEEEQERAQSVAEFVAFCKRRRQQAAERKQVAKEAEEAKQAKAEAWQAEVREVQAAVAAADEQEAAEAYREAEAVAEAADQLASEAVVVADELQAAGIVCGICAKPGDERSYPCCGHKQAACLTCYDNIRIQFNNKCPFCRIITP